MAEIKAVADKGPDPKLGVPRRQSETASPYYNLDQSIEVARVIWDRAGGSCDRAQLAAYLDYKGIHNGAFLTRVTAAKMFGLIEQEGDQLRVTERGRAIVAEVTEDAANRARVDAFLSVPLFRKVYDEYHGQSIPSIIGLRNLLGSKYGIVPARVPPSVTVLMDSADQAGFFRMSNGNRTRMVSPIVGGAAPAPVQEPPAEKREDPPAHGGNGGGGGNGKKPPEIPEAILGLLKRLPAEGSVMSAAKRAVLVDAFTSTVKYLYPEEAE